MRLLFHSFGLGDLAHIVFMPFAWLIDQFWGTDLMHCDKCAVRRSRWNGWFSLRIWVYLTTLLTVALVWGLF